VKSSLTKQEFEMVARGNASKRRRPTIQDIADETGVHKSTVSYALNSLPGVSDSKRSEILAAASKLDWYPSSSARALRGERAGVVGFIVRRDPAVFVSDSFFPRFIYGIEAVLEAAQMSIRLALIGEDPGNTRELELYRRWWGEGRVDGFIVSDPELCDPRVDVIDTIGAPAVMLGESQTHATIAVVKPDHIQSSRLVAAHLAERGHKKVALALGPDRYAGPRKIIESITRELRILGSEVVGQESVDFTVGGGIAGAEAILTKYREASVILTANDLVAMGAEQVINARRTSLANPPALLSWSDSYLCDHIGSGVTAISHGADEGGGYFASALIKLIETGTTATMPDTRATPVLVDRRSVRDLTD
jgi:DNA-binding LacI/PurR family transcriptional regulator